MPENFDKSGNYQVPPFILSSYFFSADDKIYNGMKRVAVVLGSVLGLFCLLTIYAVVATNDLFEPEGSSFDMVIAMVGIFHFIIVGLVLKHMLKTIIETRLVVRFINKRKEFQKVLIKAYPLNSEKLEKIVNEEIDSAPIIAKSEALFQHIINILMPKAREENYAKEDERKADLRRIINFTNYREKNALAAVSIRYMAEEINMPAYNLLFCTELFIKNGLLSNLMLDRSGSIVFVLPPGLAEKEALNRQHANVLNQKHSQIKNQNAKAYEQHNLCTEFPYAHYEGNTQGYKDKNYDDQGYGDQAYAVQGYDDKNYGHQSDKNINTEKAQIIQSSKKKRFKFLNKKKRGQKSEAVLNTTVHLHCNKCDYDLQSDDFKINRNILEKNIENMRCPVCSAELQIEEKEQKIYNILNMRTMDSEFDIVEILLETAKSDTLR